MIGKTIKSILAGNNALIALVPDAKIFPYVMNEKTELPAIVYYIDAVTPEYTKGGWALDTIDFSIWSFARSYDSLQAIVSAERTALELNRTGAGSQNINYIYCTGMDEGYDQGADVFFNKLMFNVKINSY
jgi:hypothetical protein